jgi:hypothetical protein
LAAIFLDDLPERIGWCSRETRLRHHRELTNCFNRVSVGGLVSDRLDFNVVCPNNHNQTVTFSQEEFEEALKAGALVFHCNTCDTDWPPSSEEIAKFRKPFPKNSG